MPPGSDARQDWTLGADMGDSVTLHIAGWVPDMGVEYARTEGVELTREPYEGEWAVPDGRKRWTISIAAGRDVTIVVGRVTVNADGLAFAYPPEDDEGFSAGCALCKNFDDACEWLALQHQIHVLDTEWRSR